MEDTAERRFLSCNPSVVERSDIAIVGANDDNFMMMDGIGLSDDIVAMTINDVDRICIANCNVEVRWHIE